MKIKFLRYYMNNFLFVVMKDPLRKSLVRMVLEYLRFFFTDRDAADQYFVKFQYRKNADDYRNYLVSDRICLACWAMNHPGYESILDDKYLFEIYFRKFSLNVAESLAYTYNSLFFRNGSFIQVNTPEEFSTFMKNLLPVKEGSHSLIIKRRRGTSGGKFIYKMDFKDGSSDPAVAAYIFSEVLKSEYIIQDYLLQHDDISRLNPNSLNTIRLDTFTGSDGISQVYSAMIRQGMNNAYVDNVSSGGTYVGIRIDSGTMMAESSSDLSHGRARIYTFNPVTGTRFEGYVIPFFHEALELVCEAAQRVPQLKIIGWDVAILPEGPILLEGNHNPGIVHSEISQRGFRGNPVFEDVLRELKSGTRYPAVKAQV